MKTIKDFEKEHKKYADKILKDLWNYVDKHKMDIGYRRAERVSAMVQGKNWELVKEWQKKKEYLIAVGVPLGQSCQK